MTYKTSTLSAQKLTDPTTYFRRRLGSLSYVVDVMPIGLNSGSFLVTVYDDYGDDRASFETGDLDADATIAKALMLVNAFHGP